jgi:antibiotic biosynthesis monooxygenase (ABM) superfamily enzyme
MIERHVTFDVHPEKSAEFERLFVEEYRPAMASMPGFIKVDLLREQENINTYQMVIRFETADTASAWRDSPDHQALKPKIKPLYSESQLKVYDVIA